MSLILYLVVYQYQLHIEYIAQAGYHTVGASIRMSWRRGFIIVIIACHSALFEYRLCCHDYLYEHKYEHVPSRNSTRVDYI